MIWWYWMLLGLVLLGIEMVTPGGFYILFFGLAALIVGSLAGLEIAQAEWLQWLLFSGLAILSLLIFRGPLLASLKKRDKDLPAVDTLAGESAVPREDLAVSGTGKAELRGTTWTAHNAGPTPLTKGQRCKVERIEGLTIWISAE
ncbi:MAG: NfeD family protein [Nitrospira sp.]|jgi:membrane protein implicated in regulation of membrane protease activity|nr:MAG: NfeD family protein [Nitrospira sp.]